MKGLTPQERLIFERISTDPFVEQHDLAASLGLGRSTVANHIAQLVQKGWLLGRAYQIAERNRIVCFGGAVMDRKYHAAETLQAGTSNPVSSISTFGGVARNVAENLARLEASTAMISVVGDDESGRQLLRQLQLLGVDVSHVSINATVNTAEYAALLQPDNSLAFGIADMGIFENLTVEKLNADWPQLMSATWVFADCNLPANTVRELIARSRGSRFKLAVDAVSAHKILRLPTDMSGIDILFLNITEAISYLRAQENTPPEHLVEELLSRGVAAVVMSVGEQGLWIADHQGIRHKKAIPATVVDVTGAGDSLVSGTLYSLLNGEPIDVAVGVGTYLAKLTVETDGSVRNDLTPALLKHQQTVK